ncbi:MAG: 23S rRNA (uracil(1939)-C(5))-methyltransferase RlmD, partial [Succinivibrio sp.]|nr:23S rRNA (uracil(1939)-C(5))-methyltransferase RlmD [Succinivibrio sp.]
MVSFYRPQQAKAKNIECELDCQELDLKGQGVCRRDGQICFVPGVLPGEKVRVRGSIGPKGSGRLRLLEVLTPSAQRVAPDCPYLEHCGGCTLQHVPAELALESKIAGLRRLYGKQLKAQLSEPDVIVRSQNLSYRRAARFAVRYDRGRLYLGFREEESH